MRDVMIHLRVTEQEHKEWTGAAGNPRGLSQWIREACQAQLRDAPLPVVTVHVPPKPGACKRHGLVNCRMSGCADES